MKKTIYLIRHCEYENPYNMLVGRLPVVLSQGGIKQAEELREYFSDIKTEVLFSSAVKRCVQTAEIIANGKIPVEYDVRLAETFSAYQGYIFPQGNPLDWREFWIHRHEVGGEGLVDIRDRVMTFWNEKVIQSSAKTILICSHGDPLYVLYRYVTNQPLPEKEFEMGTDIALHMGEPEKYLKRGGMMKINLNENNVLCTLI